MPCCVPAAQTGCLDVTASLALCWHQPVAGAKVRSVLGTCVSEHPGIKGFGSCWKLFQEFQEKLVI